MWQKTTAPGTYTWQLALAYAEGLQIVSDVYDLSFTDGSDVNSDGKIELEDAIFVLQKVSGLRSE